jgi:ribosome assembly protein YihI (activator of Der GTPase)
MSDILKKIDFLFETPWVSLGSKTIDLELEKVPQDKQVIINHIINKLDNMKFSFHDRIRFVNHLFQTFPVMMNKLGLKKSDIW